MHIEINGLCKKYICSLPWNRLFYTQSYLSVVSRGQSRAGAAGPAPPGAAWTASPNPAKELGMPRQETWRSLCPAVSHPGTLTKPQPPKAPAFIHLMPGRAAVRTHSFQTGRFPYKRQTLLPLLQVYTSSNSQPEITVCVTNWSFITENSPRVVPAPSTAE